MLKQLGRLIWVLLFCFASAHAMAEPVLELSVKVIDQGAYGGIEAPLQIVIRDEAEWRRYWALLHQHLAARPQLPKIDFETQQLLLVCMGQRASGGYQVQVQKVMHYRQHCEIVVRQFSPGAGCVEPMVLTQPYQVVATARSGLPLEFVITNEPRDCAR